ncbi:unnamed protein product, partial [marine sediment metagenome]
LRKSRICLYRGKPRDAARHLYRGFLECPNQEVHRFGRELVGAVRAIRGGAAGLEPWYAFLRHGSGRQKIESQLPGLLVRRTPRGVKTARVAEALGALERYILEPLPIGSNRAVGVRNRAVMLNAYFRIASRKGCEDDAIGFCRRILATPGFGELYPACVQVACRTLRT